MQHDRGNREIKTAGVGGGGEWVEEKEGQKARGGRGSTHGGGTRDRKTLGVGGGGHRNEQHEAQKARSGPGSTHA